MLVDINQIKVVDRIRKDKGSFRELAESMRYSGLINPITVTPDYTLIAGERRLLAAKALGWKQIEVRIMDVGEYEDRLQLEIAENELRKDFSLSERLEYAKRLEQMARTHRNKADHQRKEGR